MSHNKDLLTFLKSRETPPSHLTDLILEDQKFRSQKSKLFTKFYMAQLLGALISILLCPQFGLGLLDNHGVAHVFRLIGVWACGAFCGAFLVFSGLMFANFTMKGRELWWVLKNSSHLSLFLPGFCWGVLMVINKGLNFPTENAIYHIFWIGSSFVVYYFTRKWLEKRKARLLGPLKTIS